MSNFNEDGDINFSILFIGFDFNGLFNFGWHAYA